MHKTDYITLAVPLFFLMIGIEIFISRRVGRNYFVFADSLNNLSCGVLDQVLGTVVEGSLLGVYVLIYENARFVDFSPDSRAMWVFGFIGADFFYYWFHRFSHRVNFLWAGHVVHHHSEEFNFTVALRQGWATRVSSGFFYLPLAALGIHPVVFFAAKSFMLIYQFWIHTRFIDRLGPFELVFNTPSHHRVHHGINPRYIDKNYGGTFIIWDRIFGSFEPETVEPVYGTVKPLASWNPFWAYSHYWIELGRLSWSAQSWRDRVAVWFAPPGWRPRNLDQCPPPREVDAGHFKKYQIPISQKQMRRALFLFLPTLGFSSAYLFLHPQLPMGMKLVVIGIVSACLHWVGALTEGRSVFRN